MLIAAQATADRWFFTCLVRIKHHGSRLQHTHSTDTYARHLLNDGHTHFMVLNTKLCVQHLRVVLSQSSDCSQAIHFLHPVCLCCKNSNAQHFKNNTNSSNTPEWYRKSRQFPMSLKKSFEKPTSCNANNSCVA